jgi:hypothetical protein
MIGPLAGGIMAPDDKTRDAHLARRCDHCVGQ